MKRWIYLVATAWVASCFAGLPAASAQMSTDEAKNKLLAMRSAEADAYRKLAETIKGLHITSDTLVRDFVAESDVIRSELDTFVKGVRLGEPQWYEGLRCEVPAEVTVAKVVEELTRIHASHYEGNSLKGADFEQIKQSLKKDIIRVVGVGAPRPDLPPELPVGVDAVITQVSDVPARPPMPDLWVKLGVQAQTMAERAAQVVAQRRLVERICGLRVTSDTLVRDFVAEYDRIEAVAKGNLIGAHQTGVYYHHDQPIVEVTYQVPVESVITMIKAVHTKHYQGDRVKTTDIESIRKQFKTNVFEATGRGIPAERFIREAAARVTVSVPGWTGERIKAEGRGTDPAINTPQGKLKAALAAELDAKRKLAEQIHGLGISSETLVRDFITQYDEIRARLDAVLEGAFVERTEWQDGMAIVTVSVPGAEVWWVVGDQVSLLEHHGGDRG